MNKKIIVVGAVALAGVYLLSQNAEAKTNDVTGGGTAPSLFTLGNAKKDSEPSTNNYVSNYTFEAPTFPSVDSTSSPSDASGSSKKESSSTSGGSYSFTSLNPVSIEQQRNLVAGVADSNVGQTKKEGSTFNPNLNIPVSLGEKLNSSGSQSSVTPAFNFDIINNVATKKETTSSKSWWQLW
jgi:hypothetical protein